MKLPMTRTLGVLVTVATLSLACAGIMQEVNEEELAGLAVQVEACVPGEDRDVVHELVFEVFLRVDTIGFWDEVSFENEVEDAIADGAITSAERAVIEARLPFNRGMAPPNVDRDARGTYFDALKAQVRDGTLAP